METKAITHTPGPWRTERPASVAYTDPDIKLDTDVEFWIVETRVAGEVIGDVLRIANGNAEANARLMGAAPELLDALKALAYDVDSYPDGALCFCQHIIGNPMQRGHSSKCLAARAAIAKAEGRP